jgi:ribosome biogenesis GTPase
MDFLCPFAYHFIFCKTCQAKTSGRLWLNFDTTMILSSYGWNTHFQNYFISFKEQDLECARVLAIQGFKHILVTSQGMVEALVSGAMLNTLSPAALPKVGDWVAFKAYADEGIILAVLPRETELSRRLPGKGTEKQVIASNVDSALIVQGLDGNFNLMRLQRYLVQVHQCGIQPIVVLNKADLVDNPEAYRLEVEQLGYHCPVILTSATDRQAGDSQIAEYLQEGKTYVLLGSSGVGKSTLLNTLLGYHLQVEGETSTANHKGKHTTVFRQLVMLPSGSMIIDVPGMREFGVTLDSDDAHDILHPQLSELAAHCRFDDCTHQHEPGCAIVEAVGDGSLPAQVYQSHLKLTREQYHYQADAVDKKRKERQFGKMAKQAFADRKTRKY